jgi:uncharacterized protein
MKVFFDSSALVKRYVPERGTEAVLELCAQATELGISVICLPEIISALNRLRREKKLGDSAYQEAKFAIVQDLADASFRDITEVSVLRSIQILETNTLRAMDALHVAGALEWEADWFVSGDANQGKAAKAAGLRVKSIP